MLILPLIVGNKPGTNTLPVPYLLNLTGVSENPPAIPNSRAPLDQKPSGVVFERRLVPTPGEGIKLTY